MQLWRIYGVNSGILRGCSQFAHGSTEVERDRCQVMQSFLVPGEGTTVNELTTIALAVADPLEPLPL